MRIYLLLAMAVGASLIGSNCGGSGVGDPCVPEDEYKTTFHGFAEGEVNVESRSFQCLTRVCLVNHFRGRVSCPYGQAEDTFGDTITASGRAACAANNHPNENGTPNFECDADSGSLCADSSCLPGGAEHAKACRVPDRDGSNLGDRIQVPVDPQWLDRTAEKTVYCSCRCKGSEQDAAYCECPSGFACEPLVEDLKLGKGQLAGSYCIKTGSEYSPTNPPVVPCDATLANCGSTVEIVDAGVLKTIGRNDGVSCEAGGTVCSSDAMYCCMSHTPDGKGDIPRKPCGEVGVGANVTDVGDVRTCPPIPG